jgi:hypothetical protein
MPFEFHWQLGDRVVSRRGGVPQKVWVITALRGQLVDVEAEERSSRRAKPRRAFRQEDIKRAPEKTATR